MMTLEQHHLLCSRNTSKAVTPDCAALQMKPVRSDTVI